MILPTQSAEFMNALALYHEKVYEGLFHCKGGHALCERSLRMKQDVQAISAKYCNEITEGWLNDIPAEEMARRIQEKHWEELFLSDSSSV